MGDLIKSSDIWFNDSSRYNDALCRGNKRESRREKRGRSSRENEPNGVAYGATSDTHLVIDSRERKRDDVIA